MSSRKFGTQQLVPLVIAAICLVFLIVGLNKFGFWNDAQKAPTPAFVPSIICTLLIAICLITVFTSQKEDGKAKYHRDEFLIILTFMGPALANFGLKFGPAEMTTLMIMAMTSIGWLLGDDPLRGTISTLVGFVLASIGMDTLTGAPRYNFGSLHLMGGVPFVPFVIGAVGFSQVIGLMMERYNGVEMPKDKLTLHGSLLSKEQFKRLVPPAVRSGVAGTFIGVLPGSGATTASFLGYAMQKGFKSKEPLGTGAIEGVAACESANNAAAAGSFAPLLALGIPGSGTGAVLLGGLMMWGLNPNDPDEAGRQRAEAALIAGVDEAGALGIDNLSEWLSGEAAFNYLKQSLIYFNTLSLDERYAMRLMADVYGIAPDALPETVAAVPLDAQDAALSDADKRALAMETLFGERAEYLKQQTEQSTRRSVDTLVEATRARQAKASSDMRALLNGQRLLTILLVALLLVVVLLTWRLIIHPMREGVRRIRAHETLPLSGSSEMVFLANAYNEMFAQHERDARELTYSATHDALTGLCNRTAFDRLRNGLDTADACVILVDIDHFKDFNDNYGHAVGDKVLKRVARVLTQCFRTDDFVARIGGDEFCVILRRVGSEMREQVAEKVERINAMLGRQEEGLPARRRSSASG